MDEIIKTIGSYIFHGFYESIFCYTDELYDFKEELKDEIYDETGLTVEVDHEYYNFEHYKNDISKKYMEFYIDKIIDILPYDITEHEDFLFELINKNTIVDSPKYYNYRSDNIFSEIKTNKWTLKQIKNYTLNMDGSKDYIINNFKSYDGFISFISNDPEEWEKLDIMDYEENMFISLLDMLIILDNKENLFNISYEVLDYIEKLNYVYFEVYYNGTYMEYYDFLEKYKTAGTWGPIWP